jgi:hypothetical protein
MPGIQPAGSWQSGKLPVLGIVWNVGAVTGRFLEFRWALI